MRCLSGLLAVLGFALMGDTCQPASSVQFGGDGTTVTVDVYAPLTFERHTSSSDYVLYEGITPDQVCWHDSAGTNTCAGNTAGTYHIELVLPYLINDRNGEVNGNLYTVIDGYTVALADTAHQPEGFSYGPTDNVQIENYNLELLFTFTAWPYLTFPSPVTPAGDMVIGLAAVFTASCPAEILGELPGMTWDAGPAIPQAGGGYYMYDLGDNVPLGTYRFTYKCVATTQYAKYGQYPFPLYSVSDLSWIYQNPPPDSGYSLRLAVTDDGGYKHVVAAGNLGT